MMQATGLKKELFLFLLLAASVCSYAQQPGADTLKKQINILHADRISYKKVDSLNEYQMLAGNVSVLQDKTLFYCDSASINTVANVMESFGHVHINDNDSLQIYSDYLKYLGKEKKANLTGNVRLTDGKGTLTTTNLDYDLQTHIGNYYNGGKVVNGKTVLTSKEGVYYEDTRDVYFKENVVLTDPDYNIKTDTLLYNTYTGVATFTVPTIITSDSGRSVVKTKDGFYDTKNKKSYFGKRAEIQNDGTFITADEMASDSTGIGEARGKVIYRDSAQKVTIFANHLNSNKKAGSFLASEKPVMIIEQENDSIFIAADTFYSAKLSSLRKYRTVPVIIENTAELVKDTAVDEPEHPQDDSTIAVTANQAEKTRKKFAAPKHIIAADSSENKNDSTNRFFEAYYHVRIFSDSLQAVGDSMFYSTEDSAFRLFTQPIVWSRQSQITGDTIYLFTKNRKPSRLFVFENALTINKVGSIYYNQIKGRTINGYFKNGNIDFMRTKGNAESIYYAQDEDNKFIGVNKATADIIDMYFEQKKPEKVVFRSNLVGTTYPMRQINHEQLRLRGFKWLEDLRPKSQYELFSN